MLDISTAREQRSKEAATSDMTMKGGQEVSINHHKSGFITAVDKGYCH